MEKLPEGILPDYEGDIDKVKSNPNCYSSYKSLSSYLLASTFHPSFNQQPYSPSTPVQKLDTTEMDNSTPSASPCASPSPSFSANSPTFSPPSSSHPSTSLPSLHQQNYSPAQPVESEDNTPLLPPSTCPSPSIVNDETPLLKMPDGVNT